MRTDYLIDPPTKTEVMHTERRYPVACAVHCPYKVARTKHGRVTHKQILACWHDSATVYYDPVIREMVNDPISFSVLSIFFADVPTAKWQEAQRINRKWSRVITYFPPAP